MGRVYRAVDHALRRNVAIKELLIGEAHPEHDMLYQRFCNEALVASQMDHPNIAAVFDRGECDGRPWYAMQWMRGARGLDDLIDEAVEREELPPVDDGITLLRAMASALRAAHERRIWHRDVKPSNILLVPLAGGGWDSKLIDWGISHDPRSKQTDLGSMPGTVQYQAPECFAVDFGAGLLGRLEQIDHRIDLYALGVTFYEYFSGEHPYPRLFGSTYGMPNAEWRRTIADVYASPSSFPPPLNVRRPEVPDRVSAAIHRLLARDPKDRYQSADELLDDLREEKARVGQRGPARRQEARQLPESAIARKPMRPLQRGLRAVWIAALLLCTAAVSVRTALWWNKSREQPEAGHVTVVPEPTATTGVPPALRRPVEPASPAPTRVPTIKKAAATGPKKARKKPLGPVSQPTESPAKWPAFLFEDAQ